MVTACPDPKVSTASLSRPMPSERSVPGASASHGTSSMLPCCCSCGARSRSRGQEEGGRGYYETGQPHIASDARVAVDGYFFALFCASPAPPRGAESDHLMDGAFCRR